MCNSTKVMLAHVAEHGTEKDLKRASALAKAHADFMYPLREEVRLGKGPNVRYHQMAMRHAEEALSWALRRIVDRLDT